MTYLQRYFNYHKYFFYLRRKPLFHRRMCTNIFEGFQTSTVKGMKVLDRTKFSFSKKVPIMVVRDCDLSHAMKYIKKYLLKIDCFKPIRPAVETDTPSLNLVKHVFLNPISVTQWSDINIVDRDNLIELGLTEECFCFREIQLDYDNWKCEDIFKAILPQDKENLTGFSKIGHIVHVNLRDHHLEYKHVIGQVLLDKIQLCRTVVNKTNTIDNTYRNFSMELLSGKDDFLTEVKENKHSFKFDFSKVYWNPRLSTEHERIVKMLNKGDILFDVFAGVGPFSIPASKKKCDVYANDLNPESYKWLKHNAKLNKVLDNHLHTYNLDGRIFLLEVFKKFMIDNSKTLDDKHVIHVTMNLPALAMEFLDVLVGLLEEVPINDRDNFKEPIIHVYCFAEGDTPVETARGMLENILKNHFDEDLLEIFNVRNVSPKKEMMRVSFRLTRKLMFKGNNDITEHNKPCCKRKTTDSSKPENEDGSKKKYTDL